MIRSLTVALCLIAVSTATLAQPKPDTGPVCREKCEEVCTAENKAEGCNIAVGLTACRIKQERCMNACTRKCPRS